MGRKDFISNSLYGMRDHIKSMQQQMAGNNYEKCSRPDNDAIIEPDKCCGAATEKIVATTASEIVSNAEAVNICVPPPPLAPEMELSAGNEKNNSSAVTPEKVVPPWRDSKPKAAGSGNQLPEKRREEIFRLHQDLKAKVTRQLAEAEFAVSNYNEAISSLQNYSGFLGNTLRNLEKFSCPEEYDLLTFKKLENLRLEFICRNVEADKIRSNCSENGNVVDCSVRGRDFDLKSLPGSVILKFGFLAALPLIVVLIVCCIVLALVQLAAFGIIK